MSNNSIQGNPKVKDIEQLAQTLDERRQQGKKIVLCHGVFDLLHIGHIRHFQQAKAMGDVLVVTITPDQYVNKGEGRPVFTESLRLEAISALDCTDLVAVNRWPSATEIIQILKPHIYVKGSDYKDADRDLTGGIKLEEEAIRSVGGTLEFTNDITFSSSHLINQHLPVFPKNVRDYISDFNGRYSSDNVLSYLNDAKSLKVLALGETIIDEYVYCETLGKSGKEPVLAVRQIDSEKFAGGIVAVANHVAAFCNEVGLLTALGTVDSHEDFVRERLKSNIETNFLYLDSNRPTIVKRRFVEIYPFQKMFELYVMDADGSAAGESNALLPKLNEILPEFDLVLVTDYGHGLIGQDVVDSLCENARFLAVNTQVNAGNFGFNTASKYWKADFLCVSENEIRLDARSRQSDLQSITRNISTKLSCERVVITQGAQGCLCYSNNEGFFHVPALATQIIDRIGAGDAVFAAASLCAVQRSPIEISGFVGNAAGAHAVATVGNRDPLEALPFLRHLETLLK